MCFTGFTIVQDRVAVTEGPTLTVLSRYANSGTTLKKTRKGKCLRSTPVELLLPCAISRRASTNVQSLGVA